MLTRAIMARDFAFDAGHTASVKEHLLRCSSLATKSPVSLNTHGARATSFAVPNAITSLIKLLAYSICSVA
jgi:hypothetical protein